LPARASALEDPTLRKKKSCIARKSCESRPPLPRMVREGQVVILDSETTTTAIAHALREFQNLPIITNVVNIAAELSGSALEVILTGGTLRKNSFAGGTNRGRVNSTCFCQSQFLGLCIGSLMDRVSSTPTWPC
jgi:DeoR family transcriptional regulator of aga operon